MGNVAEKMLACSVCPACGVPIRSELNAGKALVFEQHPWPGTRGWMVDPCGGSGMAVAGRPTYEQDLIRQLVKSVEK